jgi:hypothetical protein
MWVSCGVVDPNPGAIKSSKINKMILLPLLLVYVLPAEVCFRKYFCLFRIVATDKRRGKKLTQKNINF